MQNKKTFWVTDNRFKFIALLLFLMFLVFMLLLFLKANEITRSPCSVCAARMSENVHCYLGGLQRIYYQNYSVVDIRDLNG